MPCPEISVIIAAYNAERTLAAAAGSVLVPVDVRIEILIIDDGSSDGTLELARSLAESDSRIRVQTQPNSGTGAAVNRGIAEAAAPWILRLDADDELAGTYFATMCAFMEEHPGFDLYGCDLAAFNDESEFHWFGWSDVRSFRLGDMFDRNLISGAGTIARRSVLQAVGGCREDIYNEDYDLWLRCLAAGARHIHCPEPLYRHRRGLASQKTSDRIRVNQSDVEIIQHLMDTVALTEDEHAAAEHAIEDRKRLIWELRTYGGLQENEILGEYAEREARALRTAVERVVPAVAVEPVLRLVRGGGKVLQPLRQALRMRRARAYGQAAASRTQQGKDKPLS